MSAGQRQRARHAKIDRFFLVCFPVLFLIFNFVYWLAYYYAHPVLEILAEQQAWAWYEQWLSAELSKCEITLTAKSAENARPHGRASIPVKVLLWITLVSMINTHTKCVIVVAKEMEIHFMDVKKFEFSRAELQDFWSHLESKDQDVLQKYLPTLNSKCDNVSIF